MNESFIGFQHIYKTFSFLSFLPFVFETKKNVSMGGF